MFSKLSGCIANCLPQDNNYSFLLLFALVYKDLNSVHVIFNKALLLFKSGDCSSDLYKLKPVYRKNEQ